VDREARRTLVTVAQILGLVPALILGVRAWQGHLGPDPIGEAMRVLGRWALAFLVLSLLPSTLRIVLRWPTLMPLRKALGLYAFKYALAHLVVHIGLTFGLRLGLWLRTMASSRFLILGLASWTIMLPLAVSSADPVRKAMGRWWRRLHSLTYLAAILAVWHYADATKELRALPIAVGSLVLVMLATRVPGLLGLRRRQA